METTQSSESQNSDLEVMKKMEDEHCRLQRQVRMIQTDRSNRIMGVHPQFRRQDHLLRTLKKEYINIMKDLKIAKSGAHKKHDKKMKTELKKQILYMMQTQISCDAGMTMMEQLDELLQRKNREILLLRKRTNATRGLLNQRRCQSEQRLVSTENKLEAAMLRFNTIQFENRKIREQIEHMLKDRASFNQTWDKMMVALSKGKKFLTDLFESSTLAYDQRDEWVTKLRSIQEKGKMDQMLQVQEMRELQKAFDHDTKIYNFLSKKGVKRVNKKQEKREEVQKKKADEEIKREYNKHVEILDEIYEYTQDENVNSIIGSFLKRERDNFSKYKLLTDICAENEVLSRDLKQVKTNIMDRREWNEMMDAKRQDKLLNVKKELEEVQSRTEILRANLEERNQLIENNMEKISDIFQSDKAYTSRLKKYTVHCEPPEYFTPNPINFIVPADPCPACIEARWLSRVCDGPEIPYDKKMTLKAVKELAEDPAYVRSDRIHQLAECRVPSSRAILARRYMNY
ncbi:hypothetical protein K1T71_013464 [Dendrolimus kikuchii]|uniref:Uncharacterized protein n=1 Tax=Dendrolimus kikuchii TaxID=765133 RepID=A0ACC1CGW6_9NEOP|nr:hypothetical protein K1T71_013464 [Dendrolimus kikuchii]